MNDTHTTPELADIRECTLLAVDGEGAPAGAKYAALLEHLRERGHDPLPPMAETYLTDPTVVEPRELVTRVAVAMRPAGGGARA